MSSFSNMSAAALSALAQKRQQQQHQQQMIHNQTKHVANTISLQQSKAASLAEAKAQAIAAANSITAQILQQQNQFCSNGSNSNTIHVTTTYNSSGQPTSTITTLNDQVTVISKQTNVEKEAEQKRLEEEMKKRRERIEKWRKEKNKNSKESTTTVTTTTSQSKKSKQWNLEDDDEDEEHQQEAKNNSSFQFLSQQTEQIIAPAPIIDLKRKNEDDEDPLDAYMKEIYTKAPKVAKISGVKTQVISNEPSKKVTIVMGVAKTTDASKLKGDIMEQDIDGLEYEVSDDEDEQIASTAQTSTSDSNILLDPSLMMSKTKSKSEMVFTDHSKVYYRPFRKSFYVEVPEIAKMTSIEVELFREELEGK